MMIRATLLRVTIATLALGTSLAASVPAAPSKSPAPVAHYANVRGIRMYYEMHGAGPVLVLLHGGAGNGEQFARQVPAFEKRFRVIVPDLCAQGRTTDREGPLTYHDMAEDVIALMDTLGIRRFDIMGWSDGGNDGLDIAIHHPDRLRRLVTFGANFSPDGLAKPDVAWNDTATVAAFGDGMRDGWTKLSPEPGHYAVAMAKVIKLWKTLPRFTPAELGSIRTPVLVCAGEHDLIRLDHTAALVKAIPGATVWIVPGASHSAMQERPDLVNPRVIGFLMRRNRPAGRKP